MLRGYDSLGNVESATPSPIADRYVVPEELASSIIFGESHLAVLSLRDCMVRSPSSERPVPESMRLRHVIPCTMPPNATMPQCSRGEGCPGPDRDGRAVCSSAGTVAVD